MNRPAPLAFAFWYLVMGLSIPAGLWAAMRAVMAYGQCDYILAAAFFGGVVLALRVFYRALDRMEGLD